MICTLYISLFFFFNDTATTEIYTLSLHDALPISAARNHIPIMSILFNNFSMAMELPVMPISTQKYDSRSEEHTSELQSQSNLVCRLLLEKKKHNTLQLYPLYNQTHYMYYYLQLAH